MPGAATVRPVQHIWRAISDTYRFMSADEPAPFVYESPKTDTIVGGTTVSLVTVTSAAGRESLFCEPDAATVPAISATAAIASPTIGHNSRTFPRFMGRNLSAARAGRSIRLIDR